MLYNVVHMEGFDAHLNLCLAVFPALGLYLFDKVYFQNNGISSRAVFDVIVLKNGTILCEHFNNFKHISNLQCKKIKSNAVWLANMFLFAFFTNGKVLGGGGRT